MSWTKLSDDVFDNPKVTGLSPLAQLLWIRSIAFSSRWRLDGVVPAHEVRRLCAGFESRASALRQELVARNFWEPVGGDFQIHDYHDYQPSREEVEARESNYRASRSPGGKVRAATAVRDAGRFAPNRHQHDQHDDQHVTSIHAGAELSAGHQHDQHVTSPVPVPVPVRAYPVRDLQEGLVYSDESPTSQKLCDLLLDLVEQNGVRRPNPNGGWATEARLLLERDGRDFDEAADLMRWATSDPFWRGNILSMGKFRAKYDQLKLHRARGNGQTKADRVEATLARLAADTG